MSTKLTGIIYRAYNTVSGKSYLGQTIQPLSLRVRDHIRLAKKYNHKFANALKCYPSESWVWEIVEEVQIKKLDERERYYIEKFNSFEEGYNSSRGGQLLGEGNPSYSDTVYELYHEKFGIISGVRHELVKVEPLLERISNLVTGRRKHIRGWVLLKNRDNYDKILGLHEFYHRDYGIVKCTVSELHSKYLYSYTSSLETVCNLIRGTSKCCNGWMLAKYKDIYKSKPQLTNITLTHDIHGTVTLSPEEFIQKYKLTSDGIRLVLKGQRIKHKGWRLVDGNTKGTASV